MIYLNIDDKLTCDKVCHAIQKLLKNGEHNGDILTIQIRKISDSNNELIPKLTYEGNNDELKGV